MKSKRPSKRPPTGRGSAKTLDAEKRPEPRRGLANRLSMNDGVANVAQPLDTPDHGNGEDTQFVVAVARALSILNIFRAGDDSLGNAEIAQRIGLTKPTVSRLTYTLARCGYFIYNPRFRVYELGPAALALGYKAFAKLNIRRIARPLMKELAYETNFNVGLGTRDGNSMIYTDTFEGDALIGLRLFPGSHLPIPTSAMGRAYLAGIDADERASLLRKLRADSNGPWPKVIKMVNSALREYEERSFCSSIGEWHADINGVAAPIRFPNSSRTFVVNLGGPAYLLPPQHLLETLGPRIAELAKKVENFHESQPVTPEIK